MSGPRNWWRCSNRWPASCAVCCPLCGSRRRWNVWGIWPRASARDDRLRYPYSVVPVELRGVISDMGAVAQRIVHQTGAAMASHNLEQAQRAVDTDEEMDRLHREMFNIMLAWTHGVEAAVNLTLVSRFCGALRGPRGHDQQTDHAHRHRRAVFADLDVIGGRSARLRLPRPAHPGGDALAAHLAADPTGHRRCRRNERIRLGGVPQTRGGGRGGGGVRAAATDSRQAAIEYVAERLDVRRIVAGPFQGLGKEDLPGQLCALSAGVLRAEASRPEGPVRPAAQPLLAVGASRLGGQGALGCAAGALDAHVGQGQEPRSRRPR